jgi:methylase of polypeptide subunit release factors
MAPHLFELLRRAGAVVESRGLYRSTVRVSSLGGRLFMHSSHPTTDPSAVFFGPDTYRFCAAIGRAGLRARRAIDVGCGTGAGGLVAIAERVVLGDVNDEALAFARVNAALAGATHAEVVRSDVLSGVDGEMDLVLANPPYLHDELGRTYRDGGGELGEALSLRIVTEAAERLGAGGTLLLYTGSAIVDGDDVFRRKATLLLERAGMSFTYDELDPDVFGEELSRPAYARVDRIAAVLLRAHKG